MYSKEMVQQILQGIVWLNNKMGVWSLIVPIVFAIAVLYSLYRCYKKPSSKNSKILLFVYAVMYIFGGFTIFIGKDFMGLKNAMIGSIALWSVSMFLILDIIFGWTEVKLSKKKWITIYIPVLYFFRNISLSIT